MDKPWQHSDIAEFRGKAKSIFHANRYKISKILKNWSKDGVVRISHFKRVRAVYGEYFLYDHWDERTSQYEIRDSLSYIESTAGSLQSHISRLTPAARHALRRAADADRQIDFDPKALHRGWKEVEAFEIADVTRAIASLSQWAGAALQEIEAPRQGRSPRRAKVRVTRLLARPYAELTGDRSFARSNPTDGSKEYGPFRKFINEIMIYACVKVNDATVRQAKSEAMAEKEKNRSL